MAFNRKDHFYQRAKREKKASRAVYKIEEMQRRFRLVAKGDCVLDLGCAPGGWLQELSPLVGPKGKVIGIDLLPLKIAPPKHCTVLLGDLTDAAMQEEIATLAGGDVDCVCSDMSPNLSGIPFADAYRSFEIASLALDVCHRLLKSGGHFVVKIFPGEEFEGFMRTLKTEFNRVQTIVPEATRKTSSERYIVALGYRRD